MIRAFTLAVQLLTRLPAPSSSLAPQPQELGLAVAFFPMVGFIIGALLAGLQVVLWLIDPSVLAALILTVWVLLTGGIHLDGLADTADAWIGGQGDRERTLLLMKDPHSGPIAIVAIVLVLLNKFAALQVLATGEEHSLLLLTPILGRTFVVLLLITIPYLRSEGLGAPYARYLPRRSCGVLVLMVAIITIVILGWQGGLLIGMLGVGFIGLRYVLLGRLGGITGDILGAACELTETAVLLAAVILANASF